MAGSGGIAGAGEKQGAVEMGPSWDHPAVRDGVGSV